MAFSDWIQFLGHFRPGKPELLPEQYPDLTGKVFIVTGGPTGVGFHVSRLLASKNAKVYLAARNQSKIDEAIEKIRTEIPKANLDYLIVDLSDLESIKPGVTKFLDQEKRLDGLILNAGVMTPPYGSKSKQGYELQLGTNCVGHWLVANLLEDILVKTAKSSPANSVRTVWVSSSAQLFSPNDGMSWEDKNFEKSKPSPMNIYGQSKAINVQQGILWGERLRSKGVVSLSVHPGNLKSELQRHVGATSEKMMQVLLYPAVNGAYSELFAALSPKITVNDNGRFVIPWGKFGSAKKEVVENAKGEAGAKLEKWLDDQIKNYL